MSEIATPADTVARLRRTFRSGRTRPYEWRRRQLLALGKMMDRRRGDLVQAMRADISKSEEECLMEMSVCDGEIPYALVHLESWMQPEVIEPAPIPGHQRIVRDPLGVVLIISPWNLAVELTVVPIVGAVAAGNCVVLKPSELSPHVSALLAEILPEYLDPDAVAVVEGGADETTALLEQRWDHIFYTGGGGVGRIVAAAAAKHLTPITLELGGKSPCIVDDDADIDLAAERIAWGKYINAGQVCIAPDYVLVKREREDELVAALARATTALLGEDPRTSPALGRIVNERHHARLARLIKDGRPAFGGEVDTEDLYVAPTVLQDVRLDSDVMKEEIFGPVLPVLPVDSIDEAIEFVNERDKPLALYLFTGQQTVEDEVLSRTSSGGACVNGTMLQTASPEMPFGGTGASGVGAYHGRHSFETFSHRKAVFTQGSESFEAVSTP